MPIALPVQAGAVHLLSERLPVLLVVELAAVVITPQCMLAGLTQQILSKSSSRNCIVLED